MDEELKYKKRNLIAYPMGTIGRDAIYQLFTNFALTFILFTKTLTDAQLLAITGIMVAARIFDAVNDPIMGYIIEKTKTKWGKFKPWLAAGVLLTSIVIIVLFTSTLQGWAFVIEFGIIYFLYSITYTMNDISYWGMIPSLSSDADTRNQFTSRAILFAGIGGTLASMLIPMFTVGDNTIGGSTTIAYGVVAVVIAILACGFICITLFGVKEPHLQSVEEMSKVENKNGIKAIVKTIFHNKQLLWIVIIFLIQQIGNGLIGGGIGSTYIYLQYGYDGGLYSLFSTIGVAATAILMVTYPMISRKFKRKTLMGIMTIISTVGYLLMLVAGLMLDKNPYGLGFWALTIGYMLGNFGQYCFYLVMMISVLNTVEYNEYISGNRDEAIIASVRPFLTKLASALIIAVTSATYLIFKVKDHTNSISKIEQQFTAGAINETEKAQQISSVLSSINVSQTNGMLLVMVIFSFITLVASYILYIKKYTLDEAEYDRICEELKNRKNA